MDAIHPDTLRQIVRDAIDRHVDFQQLEILRAGGAGGARHPEALSDEAGPEGHAMKRVLRDRLAEIERLGLTVVKIAYSGKRTKISIAAPDGRTLMASPAPRQAASSANFARKSSASV